MIEMRLMADTPQQMATMLTMLSPAAQLMLQPVTSSAANDDSDTTESSDTPTADPSPSAEGEEHTVDDIRSALAKVSENHDLMKARELLNQFGVARVSDLPAEQYSAFMDAAGELVQ